MPLLQGTGEASMGTKSIFHALCRYAEYLQQQYKNKLITSHATINRQNEYSSQPTSGESEFRGAFRATIPKQSNTTRYDSEKAAVFCFRDLYVLLEVSAAPTTAATEPHAVRPPALGEDYVVIVYLSRPLEGRVM